MNTVLNSLIARIGTDAQILRRQVPDATAAIQSLDNALLHLQLATGKSQSVHPAAVPIQQMFERAFQVVENEIAALTAPPDGLAVEDLDVVFDRQDRAQAHLNSARAAAAEFLHHFSAALE